MEEARANTPKDLLATFMITEDLAPEVEVTNSSRQKEKTKRSSSMPKNSVSEGVAEQVERLLKMPGEE